MAGRPQTHTPDTRIHNDNIKKTPAFLKGQKVAMDISMFDEEMFLLCNEEVGGSVLFIQEVW